jgi:predicted MFS family arabinose efflux permease
MLITSMYYTREEQPSRISFWYAFNGLGVAGGGMLGFAIGHIKGALASWRYEFLIVGALSASWAILMFFFLPNSPATFLGFTHEEKLMIIGRMRRNQTGIENRQIKWDQVKETVLDYKTWMYFLLGFICNIPNGGISNFSTLVIKGLVHGNTLYTSLLGIPQGVLVVIWIAAGALINERLPSNSRTWVSALFMLPTIAGALGFLLAPTDAYVGRLICFYLTGSYQASFVIFLSVITSNTAGQTKKMLVSGTIWFGACVGNIASPFVSLALPNKLQYFQAHVRASSTKPTKLPRITSVSDLCSSPTASSWDYLSLSDTPSSGRTRRSSGVWPMASSRSSRSTLPPLRI